ncbi:enoyl-CoA hydratase-related protein [Aeromicrobium duanguangcaii]|uniref:Enoyl-CoA hydratase-related protein n=1 Tax=Aeromicrobium duanguangcaii TaxID=2968086 RepID=A0ABY5KIF9_9ACTN|nr:enoyl-CoA hydratase-related protein [Aeromicrobium duanguangcaii]MCD9153136.1 enoyl-CoA hydratase-related protein [Aeromicrobium duanguangcaii]UUI69763.1 enoyl-CoA hydratase-related protein [Aeromicrobium duanguangcaii]
MSSSIHAETFDGVLVISIDRPAARNAMTDEMARSIATQLDHFDAADDLRVAVLHGRHGVFCSGMDLKRFQATGTRPLDPRRGGGGLTWMPPTKPIIAAVEGFALGLGFEMTLACDLVVAASDAQFGLPEVRHGLVAAGGGASRLPSRIPRAAAMEILLTGRPCSASRLQELGLVNRVTEPDESLETAQELAREIASLPSEAVTFTKELVALSRDWPEADLFARQEPLVTGFLERRRRRQGN